jgi:hypothetical protein
MRAALAPEQGGVLSKMDGLCGAAPIVGLCG